MKVVGSQIIQEMKVCSYGLSIYSLQSCFLPNILLEMIDIIHAILTSNTIISTDVYVYQSFILGFTYFELYVSNLSIVKFS